MAQATHADTSDGEHRAPTRTPYVPPRLDALGTWSALTLQQSVPIGPGGLRLYDPLDGGYWFR